MSNTMIGVIGGSGVYDLDTLEDKRWQAVLGGTNITDEVYLISGSSSFEGSLASTEGFHGRTAEWFLSVNYRF